MATPRQIIDSNRDVHQEDVTSLHKEVRKPEHREKILEIVSTFSPRCQEVILARLNLGGKRKGYLSEISKRFGGVTHTLIHELEFRVIRKFRAASKK